MQQKNIWFRFLRIVLAAVAMCWAAAPALAQPGDVLWSVELHGEPDRSSPVIAPNGTIYVRETYSDMMGLPGAGESNLTAVSPDGTRERTVVIGAGSTSTSSAISSNGTVYTRGVDASWTISLVAVSPDGSREWSAEAEAADSWSSPAISSNGTIYIGIQDSSAHCNLTALTPDGVKEWTHQVGGGQMSSSPAVSSNGTIYIGAMGASQANLTAVSPDGTRLWTCRLAGDATSSSPAIGANGTIYISSYSSFIGANGNLTAVSPNGAKEWTLIVGSMMSSSPAIAANGTIYIGAHDSDNNANLTAVSPDGTREWILRLASGSMSTAISSPAISANGIIYVGVHDLNAGNLTAVSPDGVKLWTRTVGTSVADSPAIAADGTVYIASRTGSNTGALTAIEGDGSGLANSAWPKFHQNNRNTGRYMRGVDSAPRQDVKTTILTTNSSTISAQALRSTYDIGEPPVSPQKEFAAKIETSGAVGRFRYELSGVDCAAGKLHFYKLFADGTHRAYEYAASDSEVEDGKWWLANANGAYLAQNATLEKNSVYFVEFCIKDNGDFDLDTTPGVIRDPCVTTQSSSTLSSSSSSSSQSSSSFSTGCALNPCADFSVEWLLLTLAPLVWAVRNKKRKA